MFGIELEDFPSQKTLNQWPLEAKQMAIDYLKLKVLNGISGIEPKIHRLRFTGHYTYEEIEGKIGKLTIISTTDKFFKIIAFGKFFGIKLRISLYPKRPLSSKFFNCMISQTFRSYEDLFKFRNVFPRLKISRAEYAIDFKCKGPVSTRNLFHLMRRYIYFPNKGKTQFYYSDKNNCTLYIGNNRPNSHIPNEDAEHDLQLTPILKIYERGQEKTGRKKIGWNRNELNTLRIEYTAHRPALNGRPVTIYDFLSDCKFYKTFAKSFKFCKFRDSTTLFPREWEEYGIGPNGLSKSFQELYNEFKSKRPNEEIEKAHGFADIRISILAAVLKYNTKWKSEFDRLTNLSD